MKLPEDSPALLFQAYDYPKHYQGKVPRLVKLTKSVMSDLPFENIVFLKDLQVECWVNSHGAVVGLCNTKSLGLKPDEFHVLEYHGNEYDTLEDIFAACKEYNIHCSISYQRINDYSVELYKGYKSDYKKLFYSDGHSSIPELLEFVQNNFSLTEATASLNQ